MLRLGSLIRRQFQPIRNACFFSDDGSARYPRKPSIEYDSNRETSVNLTGFVDQPVRIGFSVFTSSSSTSSTPGSVSGRFLASRPLSLHTSSHYRTNGLPPLQAYSTLVIPEDNRTIEARIAKVKRRLKERGIDAENCTPGQSRLMCPQCEGGDSREKSFSLLIEPDGSSAMWKCHRGKCEFKGVVQPDDKVASESASESASAVKIRRLLTVEKLELEPLCDEVLDYFAKHHISKKTLARNRVMQRSIGDESLIAFTYWRRDQLVSCKYLYPNNDLAQEKQTEKILYGLNDIEEASEIIIVQREMDKLSMEEAGLLDCVSVPESMDTEYKFLWNCNDCLMKASRIIIAADGDVHGQAFAEEVARRLGKDRCYRVKWPKLNRDEHLKDVNEVLACMGPDSLKKAVKHAEPYPVEGLIPISDYFDEIDSFYHRRHGNEYGSSTGWENVDHIYTVVPGELTLVTGVPNCGKSEWIDALLVNLSHNVGWKFALCSMENQIRDSSIKLIEKHLKKPLRDHKYARGIPRASAEEFEEGKQWLDDHFCSIWSGMDSIPSIDWVLDRARAAVARKGIRGLVIDPYNELDHHRTNQTETEYVSQLLTKIKRFAEFHSCHVWLVAHPKQLQQWDGRAPNLYDVSGSAHFINKCDNGIIIHRNRDEGAGPLDLVQVGVRKVRNSVAGRIGDAYLSYDRATGLYSESPVALIKKRP